FARVRAGDLANPGCKAAPGRIDADRGMETRIFLGMAQTIDAVAHDEPHGAGIVVRPDRLAAITPLGGEQRFRSDIESIIPRDRGEFAAPLAALAAQRREQPILMVHALSITRDLGADYARRVIVVRGAVNAADGAPIDDLHLERARGRTVMRACGCTGPNRGP